MENRDVKFRVLNQKTKNIVGYERVNDKGHFEFQKTNRDEKEWLLGINTSEDDLIRVQYTGLKDKNDIEIYEGDILRLFSCERPILFKEGCFGYAAELHRDAGFMPINNHWFEWDKNKSMQVEVIGNIFKNPELIKNDE